MIDTDDLDNMSRRDLVELLEAYNESLAEVKRLRKQLDHAHEWVLNTRWKTHDNYTDFVYFIEQTNKEESE